MNKPIRSKLFKNIILSSFVISILIVLWFIALYVVVESREKPEVKQHKTIQPHRITKTYPDYSVNEQYISTLKQVSHEAKLKKLSDEKRKVMKKAVVVSRSKKPEKWYKSKHTGSITFYTAGYESTGKSPGDKGYGITASGNQAIEGNTIAMSKQFPFGTKVKIEGFPQTFTVQDRGGAIQGTDIDVFVTSLDRAIEFGRQERTFYILN
ncbi:3D domain-containing protein [Fictibacillus nanhaiensis]|uniref:3D domain-containing protein n=1 Tax=Fictibacillus nanhaiensis TaxID=742169 RepID=UPI002E247780|nr:3D domain-containing protein [Fictibacillus nanhaiensis]